MSRTYLALLGLSLVASAAFGQSTQETLLHDVTPFKAPGALPGNILINGDAIPLLVTTDDKIGEVKGDGSIEAIVGAAAPYGRGLMAAFGHEGLISDAAFAQPGGRALLLNLLNTRGNTKPVAVTDGKLRDALKSAGVNVIAPPADVVATLGQYGAVILPPAQIKADQVQPLANWVRGGGVLIGGMPGWGFLYNKDDQTLGNDFVGQRLFAMAGLLWGTGTNGKELYRPATTPLGPMWKINKVLDAAVAFSQGQKPKMTPAEAKVFGSQMMMLGSVLPSTMSDARRTLEQTLKNVRIPIPSAKNPLKVSTQPLERLAIQTESIRRRTLPPEQIKASPAAESFPGAVPAKALRVTDTVSVDMNVPAWHGTGLYAAPGEVVEITVAASAASIGLEIEVGCCTDQNYHLDAWTRSPEVTTRKPIKTATTRVACAFGGPIYVVVPEKAPAAELTVKIANAVRMPRFVLGKTDPKEWRETIRNAPGPWADLEASRVIITLPSFYVRSLNDPAALMEQWDKIMKTEDEFNVRPGTAMRRPERIVSDEQISAGYMHSGYPIMCGNDVRPTFVDLNKMQTQGNWGIYHEIGHNHQWSDWTYDGTGEVTNNIFDWYTFDQLQSPSVERHPAITERDKRMAEKWTETGTPDAFKSDPFYALYMFGDLKDAYGWDAFKKFFAVYKTMPDGQRPKTDQDKRDGWLVNFSNVVGQNIEPLLTSYGVVTSDAAKAKVAGLPKMDLSRVRQRVADGKAQIANGKGKNLMH